MFEISSDKNIIGIIFFLSFMNLNLILYAVIKRQIEQPKKIIIKDIEKRGLGAL